MRFIINRLSIPVKNLASWQLVAVKMPKLNPRAKENLAQIAKPFKIAQRELHFQCKRKERFRISLERFKNSNMNSLRQTCWKEGNPDQGSRPSVCDNVALHRQTGGLNKCPKHPLIIITNASIYLMKNKRCGILLRV